jgi:hypothetical protein
MTQQQRPEVVDYIANAALVGITQAMHGQCADASGAEVLSACFTLTRRMIDTILTMYPATREGISKTLQLFLLEVSLHGTKPKPD